MKDIQTTQETSGALQSEVCEREGEMEKQTQGEDAPASLPRTQPPSVHFFQSITDLDTTVLPSSSSWSLSTEMRLSYSLSSPQISAVNTPTIAPKALKSTVVNHSQSESSMEVNSFIISKKMTPFHDDSEPAVTGEGEDYFLSLFGDSNKFTAHSSQTKKTWKHFTMILEEMSQSRSSALGDIKIAEVNTKGLFIKLINSSVDKELEIGNHILQQKVNGRTVSLYRFLSNITMQANSTVTVWAAASEAKHQPPSDFLWKEANKFRSSPDCTTILCKPNGEAIAWYTPIHWMQAWEKLETDIEFERCSVTSPTSQEYIFHSPEVTTTTKKIHQPKKNTSKHQMGPVQVFLKREKDAPPTLFPNCSPWCSSPDVPPHPYCPLIEPLNTSMSRSSINRQLRPHSARLDPFQVLQGPKKSGYLSYKSNR